MVQERRVKPSAHGLIATKGEGDVGHPSGHFAPRAQALERPRSLNEVHRVVVVLCEAGADSKDVGVKDDVFWIEVELLPQ
jgi:hypothetical protein